MEKTLLYYLPPMVEVEQINVEAGFTLSAPGDYTPVDWSSL